MSGSERTVDVAVVMGDGAAPEMMEQAIRCIQTAATIDDVTFNLIPTPMGWNAYEEDGDTTPEWAIKRAVETGIVFFGGVGDPKFDKTIGKEKPEMMPEARALLRLRQDMKLLLNFRPMILRKELAHLSPLRPEFIPDEGVQTVFVRFLLEDSYFGNQDVIRMIGDLNPPTHMIKPFQPVHGLEMIIKSLLLQIGVHAGIRSKAEVTGDEDFVTDIAYFRRETVEKYFRAVFQYAQSVGLPVLSIDKANVMPRYVFWRKIATRIAGEFPNVEFRGHQYVDSANALLFNPKMLRGVIPCGNEHGDILSDGGMAAAGGLGLMHSSAVNPDNGAAMFESGAGTAPTLAGQDKANPIGRILTGAMLLRHVGAVNAAAVVERCVWSTLQDGYRTADIAEPGCTKILGCSGMGEEILSRIKRAQATAFHN